MSTCLVLLVCMAALGGLGGCARSPIMPSENGPLRLGLAGQSNAILMRPLLAEVATVVGAGDQVAPIVCWQVEGICWRNLATALGPPTIDAFVWWQGESDADNPDYAAPFEDLMTRVRAKVGDPNLLIVVMQWGTTYGGRPNGAEAAQVAWVQRDAHAIYVLTRDGEYRSDGIHMTDPGYQMVSARIVQMIHERLGR